jgi:hypothetical protein
MAAAPLLFNGLGPTFFGALAIAFFKILAAYELSLHTKGQRGSYLVNELEHLNYDGGSWEIKEGSPLALLNLGKLFPLVRWGAFIGPFVENA